MRKILYLLLPLITMMFAASSCIKSEDENEGTPTCVIASFSIGDIVSPYTTTVNGVDTTYSRTIAGGTVYFNIDQVNGIISSVDSLPYWANIKRIVPTISYTGSIYCRQGGEGNEFRYFSSGNDSIDFSQEVEFLVVSSDGKYTKNYKAFIYKSENEKDSLAWNSVSTNLSLEGEHRSLARDGQLYVFAYNGGQPTVTTAAADGTSLSWTTPTQLSEPINYQSVTVFQGAFYALDDNSHVCWSDDAVNWEVLNDELTFERILAADSQRIYAADGTDLWASTNGTDWEAQGLKNIDMLPEMPVSYAAYTSKTNAKLQNVVMLGYNPAADKAVTWFKISANSESDQQWNYINISDDNHYPMPDFTYMQMVRYNGCLLAVGKGAQGLTDFADLYQSDDNGITWHAATTKYAMVKELAGSQLPLTMTVCGKNIWIIQSGGKCWRGVID